MDNGVLYAQRDGTDPAFRTLTTHDERRQFLDPVAVPLQNARVFLDIEIGSRRPVVAPAGATVHCPATAPRTKGDKFYTISVHTESNNVFVGYPASGGEARNVFRAIEKLVTAAR